MKLDTYHYKDTDNWNFSEITIRRVNLFVGATGSGKSRLLNTISNLSEFITERSNIKALGGTTFKAGQWELQFSHKTDKFNWSCRSSDTPERGRAVDSEELSVTDSNGGRTLIYKREGPKFNYKSSELPRLSPNTTGLYLFREEPAITALYEWFTKILRRNFQGDDLLQACGYQSVPRDADIVQDKEKTKRPGSEPTFIVPLALSVRLNLLKRFHSELFYDLINLYRSVFPAIQQCDVKDATELKLELPVPDKGKTPVFFIKERDVDQPVPLHELSSGMQKVLLIMTDILTLPQDGTYLIDEYENSLGVNAISFLPELLLTYGQSSQFVITSHHPYLINNIPLDDWHIFHRRGSNVSIRPGKEFAEKFGASRQQAFTKLVNDPFYAEGAE